MSPNDPAEPVVSSETSCDRWTPGAAAAAAIAVFVVAALLVIGVGVSFDRAGKRAAGEAFGSTLSAAAQMVESWDGADWQRIYRAAGPVLDLVSPPSAGSEPSRVRELVDRAVSLAKSRLRQEDELRNVLLDSMRADLAARLEGATGERAALLDLATLEVVRLEQGDRATEWRAQGAVEHALAGAPSWRGRFLGASLAYLACYGEPEHADAIGRFEALLDEQDRLARRPEHAWTHVFAGNLHLEAGSREKARAAWLAGLERFPECRALAERLAAYPASTAPGGRPTETQTAATGQAAR